MRTKAFLYSIFVHLALIGAIAFFYYRGIGSTSERLGNFVIEAPLGEVFVREEVSGPRSAAN